VDGIRGVLVVALHCCEYLQEILLALRPVSALGL
jgi:hypothetical protein